MIIKHFFKNKIGDTFKHKQKGENQCIFLRM